MTRLRHRLDFLRRRPHLRVSSCEGPSKSWRESEMIRPGHCPLLPFLLAPFLALLCVGTKPLAAPVEAGAEAGMPELVERRYFLSESAPERAELAARIERAAGDDFDAVVSALRGQRVWEDLPRREGSLIARPPGLDPFGVRYRLPRDYDPQQAVPLLVCLPGERASAEGRTRGGAGCLRGGVGRLRAGVARAAVARGLPRGRNQRSDDACAAVRGAARGSYRLEAGSFCSASARGRIALGWSPSSSRLRMPA